MKLRPAKGRLRGYGAAQGSGAAGKWDWRPAVGDLAPDIPAVPLVVHHNRGLGKPRRMKRVIAAVFLATAGRWISKTVQQFACRPSTGTHLRLSGNQLIAETLSFV